MKFTNFKVLSILIAIILTVNSVQLKKENSVLRKFLLENLQVIENSGDV